MSTFKTAKEKYDDLHSSYICLLFVGILGIIYVILDYLKVLPFSFNDNGNFMFYIVMGSLFSIFIIMGIVTLNNAKKVKASINDEENTTDKILAWAKNTLSAEEIDNGIEGIEECVEEEKYLLRVEALNRLIAEAHSIEDEKYVNSVNTPVVHTVRGVILSKEFMEYADKWKKQRKKRFEDL